MKHLVRIFSLFLICCLSSNILFAQIKFTTEVSATTIGKEDILQVQYAVSGGGDAISDIQVSGFRGWQVISGPQTSQQTSIINGVASSSFSNVYLLKPNGVGKIIVPGAIIELNGKQYKSASKTVEVKNVASTGSSNNQNSAGGISGSLKALMDQMNRDEEPSPSGNIVRPGQSVNDLVKGNLFIRVLPSKSKVYVGEPFYVDYQLVTSLALQARPSKQPVFKGVSVVDFTKQTSSTTITIGGRKFHAFLIRRVQLTALEAGKIDLGVTETSNDIPYSSYDDPYHPKTYTVTVHNDPSFIDAIPLPVAGKPNNFSGAIGQFELKTSIQNIESPVGENNMLFLTLKGVGNLNSVHRFPINWSKNIDHYDGTDSQGLDKSKVPFEVTKEFKIPFIGNKIGDANIPSFDFNYFDPNTGTYKVVKSDEINLHFSHALDKPKTSVDFISMIKDYIGYIVLVVLIVIASIIIWNAVKKNKRSQQLNKHKEEAPIILPSKVIKKGKVRVEDVRTVRVEIPTYKQAIAETIPSENFTEILQEIMLLQDKNEIYQKSRELVEKVLQKLTKSDSKNIDAMKLQIAESNYTQKQGILDISSTIMNKVHKGLYSPFFTETDKLHLIDDLNILLKRAEL